MDRVTELAKWGNSTGVRIPKRAAELANLHQGDEVRIEVEGPGVLIVRAVKNEPTLLSLVSKITPKNRHREMDWSAPQGKEIW